MNNRAGMTADWVRLPNDLMQRISTRNRNEVRGLNVAIITPSKDEQAVNELLPIGNK